MEMLPERMRDTLALAVRDSLFSKVQAPRYTCTNKMQPSRYLFRSERLISFELGRYLIRSKHQAIR